MRFKRALSDSCDLTPVRTVLVVAGAVLMVIIGLLGMHTLNTAHFGSSSNSNGHELVVATDLPPAGASGAAFIAGTGSSVGGCESTCQDHGSQPLNHADVMTACALGLLVGLFLLLPVLAMFRTQGTFARVYSPVWLKYASRLSRPPSLTVLSISRT